MPVGCIQRDKVNGAVSSYVLAATILSSSISDVDKLDKLWATNPSELPRDIFGVHPMLENCFC